MIAFLPDRQLQMLLSDNACVEDIQTPDGEGRLRIPGTEWMQRPDFPDQLKRDLVQTHF